MVIEWFLDGRQTRKGSLWWCVFCQREAPRVYVRPKEDVKETNKRPATWVTRDQVTKDPNVFESQTLNINVRLFPRQGKHLLDFRISAWRKPVPDKEAQENFIKRDSWHHEASLLRFVVHAQTQHNPQRYQAIEHIREWGNNLFYFRVT